MRRRAAMIVSATFGAKAVAAGACALGHRCLPVRGHARHHVGAGKFGAQPFARRELVRRQSAVRHRDPMRRAGQPKRTFAVVNGDVLHAIRSVDIAGVDRQMLRDETGRCVPCALRHAKRATQAAPVAVIVTLPGLAG